MTTKLSKHNFTEQSWPSKDLLFPKKEKEKSNIKFTVSTQQGSSFTPF
jgi:hypothetical protein